MTEVVDLTIYQNRAANVPKPEGYVEAEPYTAGDRLVMLAQRMRHSFSRNTFYNDISVYQPYLSSAYDRPIFACRIDNGWEYDTHWNGNKTQALRDRSIKAFQNYVVFIPNNEHAILSRFKNGFGAKPPNKVCALVDMESGNGFAGPGNHSSGANWLADELADYLGSRKKVSPYANHWDYINNWPNIASWLVPRKNVAAYGTTHYDNSYAWQYYGGVDYGHLSGYPIWSPNFGSNVDFNVIQKPITRILVDFGIRHKDWLDTLTPKQLEALLDKRDAELNAHIEQAAAAVSAEIGKDVSDAFYAFAQGGSKGRWHPKDHPFWLHTTGQGALDRIRALENNFKSFTNRSK